MISRRLKLFVSVAHRYWNAEWSHEKNLEIYGRSSSKEGVGNNLRVELEVESAQEDLTPWKDRVTQLLDHRCLHRDEPYFFNRPSTLEAIVQFMGNGLSDVRDGRWQRLTIWELERWGCTVDASGAMTFHARLRNLELHLRGELNEETGLMYRREDLVSAVSAVHQMKAWPASSTWGQALFNSLRERLPELVGLRVDLSGQAISIGKTEA